MPGTDRVIVRRDLEFRAADGGALTLDLYYPPDSKPGRSIPATVIVGGYPGEGAEKKLGCRFTDMAFIDSWGRLIAASGVVAIAYTNRAPEADLRALLAHVRQDARALGVDDRRIGLWAASGNVPLALSLLMDADREHVRCAALCYGYMLDFDEETGVADAARPFGFVNPCVGKSVEDLSTDVPIFLARSGQDECPRLNETLDRFVAAALARNLPISLVNHAMAPHAFDLVHDSETSREIIRQILGFLTFNLTQ